jgi:DNA polymerase (family X)
MATDPTNAQIAALLEEIAALLEFEDDNPFRVRAYREGALSIRETTRRVADLIRQDDLEEF